MSDYCGSTGEYVLALELLEDERYGKVKCPSCARVFPKLAVRVDGTAWLPQHRDAGGPKSNKTITNPTYNRDKWKVFVTPATDDLTFHAWCKGCHAHIECTSRDDRTRAMNGHTCAERGTA